MNRILKATARVYKKTIGGISRLIYMYFKKLHYNVMGRAMKQYEAGMLAR
jgi:hypothetical protein